MANFLSWLAAKLIRSSYFPNNKALKIKIKGYKYVLVWLRLLIFDIEAKLVASEEVST